MAKRFERQFRDRPITLEEAAIDEDVRKSVEAEYPPKRTTISEGSSSLSKTLKQAIRDSPKSIEEIAGDAGVSPLLLALFLAGERDIRVSTADRLAAALKLTIAAE